MPSPFRKTGIPKSAYSTGLCVPRFEVRVSRLFIRLRLKNGNEVSSGINGGKGKTNSLPFPCHFNAMLVKSRFYWPKTSKLLISQRELQVGVYGKPIDCSRLN
jgi:hypothetical protein